MSAEPETGAAEGARDDMQLPPVREVPSARDPAGRTPDLAGGIERLDGLLAEIEVGDEDKIRAGMGIRLALGMARELKQGKPLGSETGDLVAGWTEKYGQASVDAAVKVAREFLLKPDEMRRALGQRLGLGDPE